MNSKREPPIFILLILACLASVSAVLFTPALPLIAQAFAISDHAAQLSVSVFLFGYAIGSLPYGPLSNRFGRKPALYLGLSISIVGCLCVILSDYMPYFWLFLIGRFLMALGSAAGLKVAFTVVADIYSGVQVTQKISYLMMSFAVGPGLAMALGGFLTLHFGWVSCFYFLAAYSALILLLSVKIPETSSELNKQALTMPAIARGYTEKFKNQKLIVCSLLMGTGTAIMYLFAATAPFIGINQIGLSEDIYGLLNFVPPIGIVIGSMVARVLAERKKPLFDILLGVGIVLLFTSIMSIFFASELINVWTLFLPMPFIYIGLSLIYPNVSSLALTHSHDKSNASAIMHFLNLGSSVIVLFAMELVPKQNALLMPLMFLLLGSCMFFLRKRLVSLFRTKT